MTMGNWPTEEHSVVSLFLDEKNPRLGRNATGLAPREIIHHLFAHDKAFEVAESIALRGYFPNEPLLAVREGNHLVVVEGNRRLAALKALRDPSLLEGALARRLAGLSQSIARDNIETVPVTIGPDRRSTDSLLVGRHVRRPVLAWDAENRARFILNKLEEGYDNESLKDELGYTETDLQSARQTTAIADMARSLDLPAELKEKLARPHANVLTTLARVFDSSVGRKYLNVTRDATHGLRGTTTATEFVRGFTKLVTDATLENVSSRSLNTNKDIENYFNTWTPSELPAKKRGSFVPDDVVQRRPAPSTAPPQPQPKMKQPPQPPLMTVLPSDLTVQVGNHRLIAIRNELVKLRRKTYPNAGAVLLRVFLELAVRDYLDRTGRLDNLTAELEAKGKLPPNGPKMRHLLGEMTTVAKQELPKTEGDGCREGFQTRSRSSVQRR